MPFVPPQVRYPAASARCAKPASKSSYGTSQECSQFAFKLAAGLESGRAGPANQSSSTPSVALGAACVSAETQTDLLTAQPVVNFLDAAECPFVDTGEARQVKELELPEHANVLFLQTVDEIDLPQDTIQGLKLLLYDHRDTFASSSSDLGYCPLVEHDIDTGDARPIKQSPRRPPISAREAEDEILDEMIETGVIEPSNSSWASPVCLVKKKDGTFRFCIDYRRVNAVSQKDAYPIPDIQDALDNLRDSRYFATIDLLSGY